MQVHTLGRRSHARRRQRVGRGGKRGSYSGRGTKGQKARAGRRIRPEVRDLIKKIPKRRGHRQKNPLRVLVAVKAEVIAKRFGEGDVVTPKALHARGLIKKIGGRLPSVKIVGNRALLVKRRVEGVHFSRAS